jgi:hypothetical protein
MLQNYILRRNLIDNKRNLGKYNIESIEDNLKRIENSINNFKNNILKSKEILSINDKNIQLSQFMINNINFITNYPAIYLNILKNYVPEDIINDYSTKITQIGINEGNSSLYNMKTMISALSNFNNRSMNSYYTPIKRKINQKIDKILEENFEIILKKIEARPNSNDDFNQIMTYQIEEENKICQIGFCINTLINLPQVLYSYGFYYNSTNEDYIDVEVYSNFTIRGDIIQEIGNFFIDSINGNFVNSSISIKAQYDLLNEKTYLNASSS